MKNISQLKKRGSSLIFVMLVVAGIVTVTLGTQRLALVQFGQSINDEDNLSAYYAAKAGLEDGLNRFRFSRNADTIQSGSSLTAERFDLTTGQAVGYVQDNTPVTSTNNYNPKDQYYDLKISFRSPKLDNISINQDDRFELTGFPDSANDYYLYYKLTWPAGSHDCFVSLQQSLQGAGGNQTYNQVIANQAGNGLVYDSGSAGTNLLIRTAAGGGTLANTVLVRPFAPDASTNCNVTASFQTVQGSGGTTAANVDFDSTQTLITTTGYIGTTKRTLLGTIDRKSGQLLSVYDFNVFAGNGNIKP